MISGGRQGFDQKKMILEIDLPLQLVSRNCWHHRSFLQKAEYRCFDLISSKYPARHDQPPLFKAKSSDSEQGPARALISFEVASKLGRVFYVQDDDPSDVLAFALSAYAENLHPGDYDAS